MTLLPDLSRTKAALEAHDQAARRWEASIMAVPIDPDLEDRLYREVDRLAEEVGIAYGEDTKDRNDPATCRKNVRPGAIGLDTFVRRMVAAWEKQQ